VSLETRMNLFARMNLLARRARWLPVALLMLLAGCADPASSSPTQPAGTAAAPNVKPGTGAPSTTTAKQPAEKQALPDLERALALARHSLARLDKTKDYTATFSKRERVGDELMDEERNEIKLRHEPFSVYLRVIAPSSSAGQEVIYVAGKHDGNLIAHTTGFGSNVIGRVSLDPHGFIATRGNRYTIKDVGLKNLVNKLLELGGRKELFRDSTVKIEAIQFAERPCKQVEIDSPRPVGDFRLAIARIVLDDEWDVPVHFESHEWPPGGKKPVLNETYSYYDLKFDVGLTDRDFDPDNPAYAFP
jgi:hypothetical protein